MLRANNSCSESCEVVGGAAAVTVTRAVASVVPPGPLATSRYVTEPLGVTLCEPEAGTEPRPLMLISFALFVCQVSSVDWPCWRALGLALRAAVGAVCAGGGGGGACATLLEQPASINIPVMPAANTTVLTITVLTKSVDFMLSSSFQGFNHTFSVELTRPRGEPPGDSGSGLDEDLGKEISRAKRKSGQEALTSVLRLGRGG